MGKRTKKLALLLSAALTLGAVCGCGAPKEPEKKETAAVVQEETGSSPETQKASEKPDTSEEVTLTMYLIGDRPADNDMVFEKINERLKSEINATIDVKFMSWSEYEQKYPLIFASGEDWDMIFTADWCFYSAQAAKQGFWEITPEALETYAPMTAESMYPEAWEQAKVDGKVYMLPMNYQELTAYVWMARGDLMEKYGVESLDTFEGAEAYMQAIADNEPSMIPLDVGSDYDRQFVFDLMWNVESNAKGDSRYAVLPPYSMMSCLEENDAEAKMMSMIDTEIFPGVLNHVKDWKDKGFWSKNAVVNTQNNTESFQAGKSALALMNINTAKSLYTTLQEEHPEWNVQVFDAMNGAPATIPCYLANGMSIFSKSKHPERALMALDYLRNDEICHNLFSYGIEGVHWEAVGEKGLKTLPQSSNYSYDSNCNWGIRNDAFWRTIEGGIPNANELTEEWKKNARTGHFATFVFDDSEVKNEIAAITEIYNSDYKLLQLGFTDDPEGDVEKLREKLKTAGIEKVQAAFHEQVLEFLESHPMK